jgi:hypothetical protein
MIPTLNHTVKAPNFGPHGNFGPLYQKSLLSLKHILIQKNEENKRCRKTLDLQICFYSYFVHDSSKEVRELAKKKKSKVSMRCKVRGFYSTSLETA